MNAAIPGPTLTDAFARIAALEARLAVLEAAHRPASPSPEDKALMLEIAGHVRPGEAFRASHIAAIAREDADLAQAIMAVAKMNQPWAKAIGEALGRLVGHNIDGLVVRRVRKDGDGSEWRIEMADTPVSSGAFANHG